jgi:hypothetical protein
MQCLEASARVEPMGIAMAAAADQAVIQAPATVMLLWLTNAARMQLGVGSWFRKANSFGVS